ncbi:hypothetical protein FHS38_004044 [Streptomyces netropsis]|uniref:Uncharacterized protein n=1 Tax=Streptomyces netropsis TaxID=55404 RepID=A0A7W7PEL5_STRNE|nr:hypothetical protein [Streptomyces netropsis]GGR32974.1 hypothetical protein GCM10010219_42310 [Streptomyces netropsis]
MSGYRRKSRAARPPFPMPKGILLFRTPDGWRHSILTAASGTVCGRLPQVPIDAAPRAAQAAAVTMLTELTRDHHGVSIEVRWDPAPSADTWTGSVHPAAPGS